MNKYIRIMALALVAGAVMSSCDDKLDIVPKGKSTLENTADLEQLLNQEYTAGSSVMNDLGLVVNDGYPQFTSIPSMILATNTLQYAYLTYDTSVDRFSLTTSDDRYSNCYKWIYNSNVVIDKAPDSNGDPNLKKIIIAEAKVKRAYFHYLLVNIYAAQYDEATAATTGGVPLVDYLDSEAVKSKNTVAEVYDGILRDTEESVIGDLPDDTGDVCRVGKAFGYAVRAKALFQMKRYADAAQVAAKALKFNNTLEDRSTCVDTGEWDILENAPNNYFYVAAGVPVCMTFTCMSRETADVFSEDYYMRRYALTWSGGPVWTPSDDVEAYDYGFSGGLLYYDFAGYFNTMGVRTEDMYFILAESYIRTDKIDDGLNYLDILAAKRIDGYTPRKGTGLNESQAMKALQDIKRVECYCTYNNFFDRKRWNTEPAYRATVTRDLGDEYGTFSIEPDSPLWVMPFPQNAVRYNPTLSQNY